MADNDDKIKISELDPALTLDNTSETVINKGVSGSWVTFKMTIATLAAHILEVFSSSSLRTTNKTVVGAINELQQGGGGGGSSTLAGLTDVNLTSPTNNQILKYDSASGKWINGTGGGSSGGHTYSTSEQIVGTWIDGSPIYEVTKSFSHDNSWDGLRAIISHGISNIDTPIDFECRFYNRSSKNLFNTVIRTTDDTYDADEERIQGSLELNAQVFTQSDLIVAFGSAYILNGITIDLVVTFRYTKTST